MEIKIENCCGLDGHQKTIVACILKRLTHFFKISKIDQNIRNTNF